MLYRQFYDAVSEVLASVIEQEGSQIEQAGQWCAQTILNGGRIHAFGTGHSHMLAEEMYYRAGGLVSVNPILESSLMLHIDAPQSSRLERLSGLAEALIAGQEVESGDVLFVFSNSGRNAVPVEMALAAKNRGLKTVAITSLAHSKSVSSRHSDNLKLYEIADLVIDNHSVLGDAIMPVAGSPVKVAPTSSIAGTLIVDAIVAETAALIADSGQAPPVLMSGNLDEAEEYNARIVETYGKMSAK